MLKRTISLVAAALLTGAVSYSQSLFDYFSDLVQPPQESQKPEKAIEFDYDLDFEYYTDIRDFRNSSDIFMSTLNINRARVSPAFGIKSRQNGNVAHRLLVGVNLTKELGANPTSESFYSDIEAEESQINSKLFKEIFYYYNLQAGIGKGRLDLFAGIWPRNGMEGDYGKVFFSDDVLMSDPNIEGLLLKYRTPRFFTELGGDWSGDKGLDRYERYTVFSAGSYTFADWLAAGWAATYMRVGNSYIFPASFNNVMVNPYVKMDFGHRLGLQELSIKAGALASMQIDWYVESDYHFPMGGEATFRVKNWDLGIEDTFFYGDNFMPYKSAAYSDNTYFSKYLSLLYLGEPFYFTHRGYASGYDRVELFYEPKISDALSIKLSAVSHFLLPSSEVFGSFIGWQAKASLIFNLDALRAPARPAAGQVGKRNTKQPQQAPRRNGPAVIL
ncbi:MAG: hypothetical protein Q4G10_01335 [Bacteroidia bacterium]|nr:hypothetical protein [Bacteroidia bacterium]